MKHITALTLAALIGMTAGPAFAQSRGDFTLGAGLGWIEPDGGSQTNLGKIGADGALSPTFTFEYFVADNIGIELLASWPFKHDLELGGSKIGSTRHLPPTLSVQYHFTNASQFTPFVGVGVNYTYFFDETLDGPGAPSIDLDDSWGVALHAGLDRQISEKGSLRLDVRYIDIETDLKVGGIDRGSVDIDPWVFNVGYVRKF